MGNKQYRKLVKGCPICGNLFCRFYGYPRSAKRLLNRKQRILQKRETEKELKGE